MKRIWTSGTLMVALVALGTVFTLEAQDRPAKTIKHVNAQPTATINGNDLFREYCAVCHGTEGKGNGPAADALNKRPADLTQLTRKNGGQFPELHVINFIKGQDTVAAHGSRDMPIWGSIFSQMSANGDQLRVYNLMMYLEQLQAK